ncbi:MAG: hypothetical protein ACLGIO_08330 [Acidimicrobiia bacterium]
MTDHDITPSIGPRPVPGPPPDGLEREMDRLSLAQALLDVEVANARVVDLTHRLITAGQELATARRDLEALRREHDHLRSTHEQMRRSKAFKLANRIWNIRNAL